MTLKTPRRTKKHEETSSTLPFSWPAWAIQIVQTAVVVDHMHVMVHVVVVSHPSAAGPRAAARVPGSSARVPRSSACRAAAAAAAAVVHVVGVRSRLKMVHLPGQVSWARDTPTGDSDYSA